MRFFVLALSALTVFAGDKKPVTPGRTSNDNVEIQAFAKLTKEEVSAAVGAPLDDGFIVVEITVIPKNGQTIRIDRDDFTLVSAKDGQRSTSFTPSQIAGSGGLIIAERSGGGAVAQQRRPTFGGMGFPGSGSSIGSTTANTSKAEAIEKEPDAKENPALPLLKEKILPEKEVTEPITGQLYFLLEGKRKLKDLDFYYKAPGGRLSLRFVR